MRVEYNFDKTVPAIKLFFENTSDLTDIIKLFESVGVKMVGSRGSFTQQVFKTVKQADESVTDESNVKTVKFDVEKVVTEKSKAKKTRNIK